MSDKPKEIINYQLAAKGFTIGEQHDKAKRPPRRPPLKDALEAAQKAGITVKGAIIENGKIILQFGDPTAAASSDEWDKAIEKAIAKGGD